MNPAVRKLGLEGVVGLPACLHNSNGADLLRQNLKGETRCYGDVLSKLADPDPHP